MKTEQRRRSQAPTGRKAASRKSKGAVIACSMECAKPACTVCAACERPLCEDHTVRIPFGANPADVLSLELCTGCSVSKGVARGV